MHFVFWQSWYLLMIFSTLVKLVAEYLFCAQYIMTYLTHTHAQVGDGAEVFEVLGGISVYDSANEILWIQIVCLHASLDCEH